LQEDRRNEDGAELRRVIRRAVAHIQQSRCKIQRGAEATPVYYRAQQDPLQHVQFEVSAGSQQDQVTALYMRYIRRLRGRELGFTNRDFAARYLRKPVPRLSDPAATATLLQNVTAIDAARGGKARK
jgi:hypothetical protein